MGNFNEVLTICVNILLQIVRNVLTMVSSEPYSYVGLNAIHTGTSSAFPFMRPLQNIWSKFSIYGSKYLK